MRVDMMAHLGQEGCMGITPQKCRAARGWLDWSRQQLAAEAKVGRNTIARYETEHQINDSTLFAIVACLERNGFRFPDRATLVREEER